jgi:nucleoside-diphosphate-sugar epimerase
MQALILGCGYVGKAFGAALHKQGISVAGTCRQQSGQAALEALGIVPVVFDGSQHNDVRQHSHEADIILASIPPTDNGDEAFALLAPMLANQTKRWVGYLSTTGIYGDRAGGWVFEDDPPTPLSREAQRRVLAESQWRLMGGLDSQPIANAAHVFRLPGIYGPGRSALDQVKAGSARRIDKPGQVFSRAHRDDIAAALVASLAKPNPGQIYNICDDLPCPSGDVTVYACELLGVPAPTLVPFEEAGLSEMGRRFYSECKRVSNARAKAELGWRPAFPTYREGLRECMDTASTT